MGLIQRNNQQTFKYLSLVIVTVLLTLQFSYTNDCYLTKISPAPVDVHAEHDTLQTNNTTNNATNNTPLKGSSEQASDDPKLKYNTAQDDKCKRMFEWTMIDHWIINNPREIDFENLPQSRHLVTHRMGGPSAKGDIDMTITVQNKALNMTVISCRQDGFNLWHRMVPEYSAWVSLQVAQRKFNLTTNRTVFLLQCGQDPAPEWSKMGEVSCDQSLIAQADVVITPPKDGLLWDLAWDLNFECHNSDMFKAFRSQFVDEDKHKKPVGCFISRQERPSRKVINYEETLTMMKEVFPRVRVIHLTKDHTTDETTDLLDECRVLFGVHGAGHMNSMFTRPGVAVVEMWGSSNPAYFRNINMLLGQHYENIKGDPLKTMKDDFNVDLKEAKAALIRARDHAMLWTEEHGGQWRR